MTRALFVDTSSNVQCCFWRRSIRWRLDKWTHHECYTARSVLHSVPVQPWSVPPSEVSMTQFTLQNALDGFGDVISLSVG